MDEKSFQFLMVYGRKAHFLTDRGKTVCIQSVLHARELFFASAFPVDFPLAVVFAEECRLFVERSTLSAVNRGGTLGISTFFFSAGYPLQGASTLLFMKKRFSPGWFDLAFREKEVFTRVVRPCFS